MSRRLGLLYILWLTACVSPCPSAHATIARQAVFGGQPVFRFGLKQGSLNNFAISPVPGALWYDDDYNVFYNPAYVNENPNYAVVEKGFEGGFFHGAFEKFSYGLYFNRGNPQASDLTQAPGTVYGNSHLVRPGLNPSAGFIGSAQPLRTQRPVDVFIAGETVVKWGAHLSWASNRDETAATQPEDTGAQLSSRYWHVDAGLTALGFEPFLGLTFASRYESSSVSQTADQSLNEWVAGLRFKFEGWNPYLLFRRYREIGQAVGAPGPLESRMTVYGLGVSHDTKLADGVHLYKNAAFWQTSAEDALGSSQQDKAFRQRTLPLNAAVEGEATSWLTLRAGASYNLIHEATYFHSNAQPDLDVGERSQSLAEAGSFRVGATLKFGKLNADCAFGTGQPGSATNLDETRVGFDSQSFALFSAAYRW